MSDARLTSEILAGGLMRLANRCGGFAAVLAKGDPTSGALLLQLLEKGQFFGLFERVLDLSGHYLWTRNDAQSAENKGVLTEYLSRRRSRDPDLWIIELDVPDGERFIAESLFGA
jgi:hypothetical protein